MKSLLLLTLVLATCWASDPILDEVPPQPIQEVSDDYRLPDDVIPKEYNINLEPTFESSDNTSFTFKGRAEITLDVIKNTNTIKFHAKELNFSKISLTYENNKIIENIPIKDKFEEDLKRDFVTVTLEKGNLNATMKNLKLSLDYKGTLNDELRGFYRSSYQNKEGKKV